MLTNIAAKKLSIFNQKSAFINTSKNILEENIVINGSANMLSPPSTLLNFNSTNVLTETPYTQNNFNAAR